MSTRAPKIKSEDQQSKLGDFPVFDSEPTPQDLALFVRYVREAGERLYRNLPWRNVRDPYKIWISEAMLQQTQVARVKDRWERFIDRFPSIDALASAAPVDVLEEWQGLGYNRRALAIKNAADICSADYAGEMPKTFDQLVALPGIGSTTAAGILAFSEDVPGVYLETNVRAVYIAAFFPHADKVSDKDLARLVRETCPNSDVRAWYYALMDIGVEVKRTMGNPTRKASAYTRQSAFEGSHRQKRAEVLRRVIASDGLSTQQVARALNDFELMSGRGEVDLQSVEYILLELSQEGFFKQEQGLWRA